MSAAQQLNQFQVSLSVVRGPHAGQVFHLNKDKIIIGRGPENDVVLVNDPQVSRLHAQVILVDREFEIVKLSQKNAVLVDGSRVDRWKLVNGSTFVLGESEIRIDYDLGQAVVSVPQQKIADVVQFKSAASLLVPEDNKQSLVSVNKKKTTQALTKANTQLAVKNSQQALGAVQQPFPPVYSQPNPYQQQPGRTVTPVAEPSLLDHPKFTFYAILTILVVGVSIFFLMPEKTKKSASLKPTLKYEDEVEIKLNSKNEKEQTENRESIYKERKESPQYIRTQENFMKGMRDFQLGNYSRSMDFFQMVLNLDPGHQVARRYWQLSKIRYDELIQAKLMLGESYYNKHNFKMCTSMYQQVMNMLDDKKADTKYKLAEKKAKECELASEGIR